MHRYNNENGSTKNDLQVVSLNNCLKCSFESVDVNDNIANLSFIGFDLNDVTNSAFKNCNVKFNQLTNSESDNSSFSLTLLRTDCSNNQFINCVSQQNYADRAVNGFIIKESCNDNIFKNCKALSNMSTGRLRESIIYGFNLFGNSRNMLIKCIAENNSSLSTAAGDKVLASFGYEVNFCLKCVLMNCSALAQSTASPSLAVGFRVLNRDKNDSNLVKSCTSVGQDIGYEIDPAGADEITAATVWIQNFASKNVNQYVNFPVGSNQVATSISDINTSLTCPWTNAGVN